MTVGGKKNYNRIAQILAFQLARARAWYRLKKITTLAWGLHHHCLQFVLGELDTLMVNGKYFSNAIKWKVTYFTNFFGIIFFQKKNVMHAWRPFLESAVNASSSIYSINRLYRICCCCHSAIDLAWFHLQVFRECGCHSIYFPWGIHFSSVKWSHTLKIQFSFERLFVKFV